MKNVLKTLIFSTLILAFSCGDSKKEEKKEGFSYDQPEATSQEQDNKETASNTIVLLADDMMKFNMKEIRVKAGQKVSLTLKHTGSLDIKVMGHNFVLLKPGVDLVDFASRANAAGDTEYIPDAGKDVIAHTKLIGGGQETTIEFEAPEAGTYKFLCSFPGHYGMMQGDFIVE